MNASPRIIHRAAALASALALTALPLAGSAHASTEPAARTGAVSARVAGAIGQKWIQNRSVMGAPITNETCTLDGKCQQRFKNGYIVWSAKTGAKMMRHGDILTNYQSGGWLKNPLGMPASDKQEGLRHGGQWQRFEKGGIFYSNSSAGTHSVRDGIWNVWSSYGVRENGPLGYPSSEETWNGSGWTQTFQHGGIFYGTGGHAGPVIAGMHAKYVAMGAQRSVLGYPIGPERSTNGVAVQSFTGGRLYWKQGLGAVPVIRGMLAAYLKLGAERSSLGAPRSAEYSFGSGYVRQDFERGSLFWERRSGRVSTQVATATTAVTLCDSQCDGISWSRQGLAANGFTDDQIRAYGGGGYAAIAGRYGASVTRLYATGRIPLPVGDPGLVALTLGGNDATQGKTDTEILKNFHQMIALVRNTYPKSKIAVNGVMSRLGADHARRRAVDALITKEALRMGLPTVSVSGWGSIYGAQYKDGVHLTQSGHNTIAPHYAGALRSALDRR